jgi:hypothetical protein
MERLAYELDSFRDFVGTDKLARTLQAVRRKAKARLVISREFYHRFAIPLSLYEIFARRPHLSLQALRERRGLYAAASFVSLTMEIARHLTSNGRDNLRARVFDVLKPDRDARALAHEYRVAAHLSQSGWDVAFVELEGQERFDFLVRREDQECDVECKTFSADAGQPVHREEFEIFGAELRSRFNRMKLCGLRVRIDLCLQGRIPKDAPSRKLIIDAMIKLVGHAPSCVKIGPAIITVSILPPSRFPFHPNDPVGSASAAADQIRGERNAPVLAMASNNNMCIVQIYSLGITKVETALHGNLREACNQMSRNRAGIVWVHLVDLTSSELASLVGHSLLDSAATKLLQSDSRMHVAGLLFSGDASLQPRGGRSRLLIAEASVQEEGNLYKLLNDRCTMPFSWSAI